MPNKTIYVKDEDLAIFEEAEKLGGDSLSAVIAEAVKRFVSVKRGEGADMKEYTLNVGIFRTQGVDDTRKIRFVGRLLAEGTTYSGQFSDGRDRGTKYRIYQSRAGKVIPVWEHWSDHDGENTTVDYIVLGSLPDQNDEFEGAGFGIPVSGFPGSLLQEAAEKLGQEMVEFIE